MNVKNIDLIKHKKMRKIRILCLHGAATNK